MPMEHSSKVGDIERQSNILQEMSDYFIKNKFNVKDKESVAKLEEYLYKLFSIRAEAMGYKPILSEQDQNTEKDGTIALIFDSKPYTFKKMPLGSYSPILESQNGEYFKRNPRIQIFEKHFKNIKDERGIYEIIKTLYHELEHAEQDKIWMSQDSSKEALGYAIYGVARIFLGEKEYKKHHSEVPQEIDAYSNFYLMEYLHAKNLFGGIPLTELNADYYYYRFEQANPLTMELFEKTVDSQIFKNNNSKEIELAKKYIDIVPMLKKKYVIDSNRQIRVKSCAELIDAMKTELHDIENDDTKSEIDRRAQIKNCKEMYFELIYKSIQDEKLSDEEIQNLGHMYSETTSLFEEMSKCFEDELEKCNKYARLAYKYCKEEFNKEEVGSYYKSEMEKIEKYYSERISKLNKYHKNSFSREESAEDENEGTKLDVNTEPSNFMHADVDNKQKKDLIDPKKIKHDTVIAGINISEINRMIIAIKDKVLRVLKKHTIERSKHEDNQSR